MNVNLLNLLKDQIDGSLIQEAGRFLGEDDSKTEKAVANVLPTLLGGLASKASAKGGAESLLGLLNDGGHDGSLLNSLGGIFGGGSRTTNLMNAGSSLMSSIFGGKLNSVAGLISGASGISSRSSSSLMSMLAPVVMGLLGKVKNEQNLDAGGLASLLQGQSQYIKGAAPAGLASALGLGSFDDLGGNLTGKVQGLAGDVKSTTSKVVSGTSETVRSAADKTVDTGRKVVNKTVDTASRGGATASRAADTVVETGKSGGGGLMKLLPLLLIPLLAFFGWKMFSGGGDKGAVKSATHAAKDAGKTGAKVIQNTGKAAGTAAGNVKDAAGNVVNKTGNAVGNAAGNVKDAAGNAANKVGGAAGNLKDAANNAANKVGGAADKVGNAAGNVKGAAGGLGAKIKNAAEKTGEAAKGAAEKTGAAAKDAGKALGSAIKFPPGSAQAKMMNYIKDGKGAADIAFRNIDFAPNTATLLPTASGQMKDIAKLMAQYPNVKLQIAGKAGANSAAQATAIKTFLEKAGVPGSRVTTTTGTAKHVSVKVTGK